MTTIENLRYYALSDIGLRRKRNEDAYAVYESPDNGPMRNGQGMLFAVADGIGGNSCGDRASRITCDHLKSFFNGYPGSPPRNYSKQLEGLARSIDRKIKQQAIENPGCEDMGTTLSVIVFAGHFAVSAHVGDSRIYRLRNGRLDQLTKDHTFVQEMIDEGELAQDEAARHPLRNVLTRALGTQEPLEKIEIDTLDIAPGDCFMLSTDGLHGLVPDNTIEEILKRQSNPKQTAEKLLQTALRNGGNDNVTIIVIHL